MSRPTANLEQPVVDIWVKQVPTVPLPEPNLEDETGQSASEFA
jgi:hypothetical protein